MVVCVVGGVVGRGVRSTVGWVVGGNVGVEVGNGEGVTSGVCLVLTGVGDCSGPGTLRKLPRTTGKTTSPDWVHRHFGARHIVHELRDDGLDDAWAKRQGGIFIQLDGGLPVQVRKLLRLPGSGKE